MSNHDKCRICEVTLVTKVEKDLRICGICVNLDELMRKIEDAKDCPVCMNLLQTEIEKRRQLCWVCNRLKVSVEREAAAEAVGEEV